MERDGCLVARQHIRPQYSFAKFAIVLVIATLAVAIVGSLNLNFASADGSTAEADSFGIAEQSQSLSTGELSLTDSAAQSSEATVASLGQTAPRDVSAGVAEIQAEEEAARIAAEEARIAAEKKAVDQADQRRSRYLATYGSLPAGDVDFSIGREAFIELWTDRINDYLAGFPLAGHGSTFAEAAWEFGVDPRWSPAISNTESTRGTVCFNPYNAWGWGSSTWSNWDQAIYAHVKGLSEMYGFTISYSYAQIYCPPNYDNWYRDTLNEMTRI